MKAKYNCDKRIAQELETVQIELEKRKTHLAQIIKLLKDNGMWKAFVSKKFEAEWSQEPSKEQVQITLAKIHEILKDET